MSEHILNKAKAIVIAGNVKPISATEYLVKSTDSGKLYDISIGDQNIMSCNCTAYEYRGQCSHVLAVVEYRERTPRVIQEIHRVIENKE